MRRVSALAVVAVAVCAPPAAHAQSPEDRVTGAALFREGRDLLNAGQIPEACRKFEASRQLDPEPGTILNLGHCHDLEGRTATAMTEYEEALALAKRDNRDDRVRFASDQIAALAPRLSRLTIEVPEASACEGMVISRDGSALPAAGWNTAIAVDPGTHLVEASCKDRVPWSSKVTVGPTADSQTVTVPPLAPAPPEPMPVPAVEAPAPLRPPAQTSPPLQAAPLAPDRTPLVLGIVAGAVGIASLGIGTYYGVHALSLKSQADRGCPTTTTCDGPGYSANQDAKSSADVSTVTIIGGLAAVAAGVYLVLRYASDARGAVAPDHPPVAAFTLAGPWVSARW